MDKVRPGDNVRFSARAYNAFVDAARQTRDVPPSTNKSIIRDVETSTSILCKNASATGTIPKWGFVELGGAVIEDESQTDYLNRPVLTCDVVETRGTSKIGIARDPIKPGEFGRVIVSGITFAKVTVRRNTDTHVIPSTVTPYEGLTDDHGFPILHVASIVSQTEKYAVINVTPQLNSQWTLYGEITGNTQDDPNVYRWKYNFIRVIKTGAGYSAGAWSQDNSDTQVQGVCYNLADVSANTFFAGSGTPHADFEAESGIRPLPIRTGSVVRLIGVPCEETGEIEYWVDRVLGWGGPCEIPTPTGPADVGPVTLWHDASTSTITAGNQVGDTESTGWTGSSDNAYSFWRNNGGSGFTARDNEINNLKAFEVGGGELANNPPDVKGLLNDVSGVTLFAAVKANTIMSGTTIRPAIYFSRGGGQQVRAGIGVSGDKLTIGGRRLDGDSYKSITEGSYAPGEVMVISGYIDYANATAKLFKNGTEIGSDTSFQTAGNTSNTDSQSVAIGRYPSYGFDGFVAEIAMYDSVLSDADRQAVETYLTDKWLEPDTDNCCDTYTVAFSDGCSSGTSVALQSTGTNTWFGTDDAGNQWSMDTDGTTWTLSNDDIGDTWTASNTTHTCPPTGVADWTAGGQNICVTLSSITTSNCP